MFNQLGDRLKLTFRHLRGRGRLSEDNIAQAMREVRIALLEADVALAVAREFVDKVKARALGREVSASLSPGQAVIGVVKEELVALMGDANDALDLASPPPVVVLLAGLQGAGKTTTTGKLARHVIQRRRKTVLVASVDVHRPAAARQLRLLCEAAGARFFDGDDGGGSGDDGGGDPKDAATVAAAALAEARKSAADVLLIDSAGRQHIDAELMDEIRRIHAAVKPHETLFVADSLSGQDAVNSARAFDQALALTGVVLTKTDGDARGGAALSIRAATGKPIKFLGVGEGIDALEAFHPERVASRILGMGDVLTLVEEAERQVDKQQAEKMAAKIARGRAFDLEDFRAQLLQMEKMGGMPALLEKLPGLDRLPAAAAARIQGDDKKTVRAIAIINAMTPHERKFPAILRASRKRRIAQGAGRPVQEVNQLLKQFMQTQKMMKQINKKGGMKQLLTQMQRNRI